MSGKEVRGPDRCCRKMYRAKARRVVSTLADSYAQLSPQCASGAAEAASQTEIKSPSTLYTVLLANCIFQPLALETPSAIHFTALLFERCGWQNLYGDPRETSSLWQRISVLIRGLNAIFISRTKYEDIKILQTLIFSARKHAERAICYRQSVRPYVRLSVCPSHGWISQKRLNLGSCNFHHTVAPSLSCLRYKFHPDIPTGSPSGDVKQ